MLICSFISFLLSEKGIEPLRQYSQQSLSLSCIPIPALGLRLK